MWVEVKVLIHHVNLSRLHQLQDLRCAARCFNVLITLRGRDWSA